MFKSEKLLHEKRRVEVHIINHVHTNHHEVSFRG